jgi:hypothetical protein
MERLFSPCTRLRNIFGRHGPHVLLRELELDVSTEDLLSAERSLTYADFYAMLENRRTVTWMTPYGAVMRANWRALEVILRRTGSGHACFPFKKTRQITYRAKVMGRALLAARTNANTVWMLLSGNPEVAVPSTTASLPTPTTVPTAT